MSRFRVVVAFLSSWVMVGVLATLAPVSSQAAAVTMPGGFTSLVPARLLDTRAHVGVPTTTPVPAGGTVHLQVTGQGGVPATGVSAVVLNVTVTGPTAAGYVTVHGDQTTRPTVSNLNFSKGQTVPNLVIAPVGDNGKVALYNGSAGTTHLIADIAGYYRSEALGHTAWTWGRNGAGQLGDGTTTNRWVPVQVGIDTHWGSVAAGFRHTAAVKTDGTLWAWGYNEYGQLGDGTITSRLAPVQVGTDTDWVSVAVGNLHTVALRS